MKWFILAEGRRLLIPFVGCLFAAACITVPPESETSSSWVGDVCAAFSHYNDTTVSQANDLAVLLQDAEAALAVELSTVYIAISESGEDLLSELRAVENLVDQNDRKVYELFEELAASSVDLYSEIVNSLQAIEATMNDSRTAEEEAEDLLLALFANLQGLVEERQVLLEKVSARDIGEPNVETVRMFRSCDLTGTDPASQCLLTVGEGCVAGPSKETFEPWELALVAQPNDVITNLEDVALKTSDFEGNEWEVEVEQGEGAGVIGYAKDNFAAGCPSAETVVPPIPEHGPSSRWLMGALTRPAIDPGTILYVIEQYPSIDAARDVRTSIQGALSRCGAEIVDNNDAVIGEVAFDGSAGVPPLLLDSEFGDVVNKADAGEMKVFWISSGVYVGLVMTDPYGIGTGGVSSVVDELVIRLETATEEGEGK